MEDRITPILYLELADAEPEEYAAARVEQILGSPGVDRVSGWRNLNPHRKDFEPDFVFRVPDFATLAVYEAQPDFVPPAVGDGIRRPIDVGRSTTSSSSTTSIPVHAWANPSRTRVNPSPIEQSGST